MKFFITSACTRGKPIFTLRHPIILAFFVIFNLFRSQFPDHEFIGEESMSEQKSGQILRFSEKPTWIIDPIDGTMNFVHSNPLVTISVALAINHRLVIGIIAAPCIGKIYTAIKGQGAKLNGKPIKVKKLHVNL